MASMANDTSTFGWKLRTRNKLSAYWSAPDHVAASHAFACDRNEQRHPTVAQRQQREHATADDLNAWRGTEFEQVWILSDLPLTAHLTHADACQRNRDWHHHWQHVKLAILNRRAKAAR